MVKYTRHYGGHTTTTQVSKAPPKKKRFLERVKAGYGKVQDAREKYGQYQTESREKRIKQYARQTKEEQGRTGLEQARARTRKAKTTHRPKPRELSFGGSPFGGGGTMYDSPFGGGTAKAKPKKKRRKKRTARKQIIIYR